MDGILVVRKEKGYTSRDVVNQVSKILGTKKIGHTGTLDPLATGVLVLCIGQGLKLVELLTDHDKEYIATVLLGVETDTLDITGKVVKRQEVSEITEEKITEVLRKFLGKTNQEVPKYSAVKVAGRKLYEYARRGEEVSLPVKEIEISEIKLLGELVDHTFTFHCTVSRGTYIRSLVRDIGNALGTVATMVELERTRVGNFWEDNSYTLADIQEGNYQILSIEDVLHLPIVVVDESMEKKIRNGAVLKKFFQDDMVQIKNKEGMLLAIYQKKDDEFVKPYRMFIS